MTSSRLKQSVPVLGTSLGAITAAFTAVAASLCCVGPAVVAWLGVSGAVAVAKLGAYRPYLLAAGTAMLAVGFYAAYRRGGVCRDGTCSRARTRFVKITLWSSALAMLGAILLPYLVY